MTEEQKQNKLTFTEHQFQVGDKVVIRPKDHPGHRGSWGDVYHDQMVEKILTVKSIQDTAFNTGIFIEEYPEYPHYQSRFEPFEYKFKEGDKVITRPHDHPGHKKHDGDANLVAGYDNQILTIASVKTKDGIDYVTFKEQDPRHYLSNYWASRFEPMPDGFVPKLVPKLRTTVDEKKLEAPNQVYIDHIYERLIQNATPEELFILGERLKRVSR